MWGTRDDWWEGSRPGTDTCDPTTAAPVGQSPLSSTRLNSHSGTCPLLPTPSLQLVCPALSLEASCTHPLPFHPTTLQLSPLTFCAPTSQSSRKSVLSIHWKD